MIKFLSFFVLITTAFIEGGEFPHPLDRQIISEEILSRRIESHLIIEDYPSAVTEARRALLLYPQSSLIYEGAIRSLAKVGDEKGLLQTWDAYAQNFPEKKLNRPLIEEMAWGVMQKAAHSSSIIMREMSLLAAFFSQDARGVTLLHEGMKDSNYAVRIVAVKLASHFRDHKLIEEVKRLFHQEKVWAVRQEALEAIGKMKIISFKGVLERLIESNESLPAEKGVAIASLLQLLDGVNRSEVEALASSNRSGLRQLCCRAVAYFQMTRDLDQLFILAKDPHPDVRASAFQAIGQLRPNNSIEEIIAIARGGAQDLNDHVSLSATWLLFLYAPLEGQTFMEKHLTDQRSEVRLLAAATLAATGRLGIPLMLDQFRRHPDCYVRLNLALGLIGQRQATEEAANHLKEMLMLDGEKWSQVRVGMFEAIINKPSPLNRDSLTTAETDHQLLRLELLNLLAMLKVPDTESVIRKYLNERSSEISATAAILLLTEGDEAAIELVQQLLQDTQPRVRLQAALILSLWSREESAIQVLEEGYVKSDWEMKGKILEGIGRIGATRSIPFLIEVLKEPSQTLRLIGAMALIQCLNH